MDLSKWMSKQATAEALGCSEKTVDRHTARGSLTRRTRQRAGLVSQSVYDPATVAALKARLTTERELALERVSVAVEPVEEPETALSVARPASLEPVLEALARLPQHWPIYLTWDEARAYSGMTRAQLGALVVAGKVGTIPYGRGKRLRRDDIGNGSNPSLDK